MISDKKFMGTAELTQATVNLLNIGGELVNALDTFKIYCYEVDCSKCLFIMNNKCQYGHYHRKISSILSDYNFKHTYPELFI